MTESPAPRANDGLSVVREIMRRSGHEIRNSLSGVAVNVEVVRTRVGSGEGRTAPTDVRSFAERASLQVAAASRLTDATLVLVDAVLKAEASGSLRSSRGHDAATGVEIVIYGEGVGSFLSSVTPLAEAIGVRVEQRGQSVILQVLPED